MKRFSFHLESVLELRKSKEEQEEEKYFRLVNNVSELDRRIEETGNEQKLLFQECARKMAGRLSLDDWRRDMDYGHFLDEAISRLNLRRQEAEKERLQQRRLLVEASKKRKILEALKENYKQEYFFEAGRQEQLEIDDWASLNFLRRGK